MRELKIAGGVVLLDDDIFEWAKEYSWQAHPRRNITYARRNSYSNGKATVYYLHRQIMGEPEGFQVDHKNGNGLDCRKENLRVRTQSGNLQGFQKKRKSKSAYRGVWRDDIRGTWNAYVGFNGKKIHLGRHEKEVDAAIARDLKAVELGFPKEGLNFPELAT
jgi:HNH endonuclease